MKNYYGSVIDWIYSVAGGISPVEEAAGFEKIRIAPKPNKKMDWLKVSLDTTHGKVVSEWYYTDDGVRYEMITPTEAQIVIGDKTYNVKKGSYVFYSE